MRFPNIPKSKIYNGDTTPEQDAQMKLVQGIQLDQPDIDALQESVKFYEQAYPFLKSIDLSKITYKEEGEIIKFIDTVLNYQVLVQNSLRFKTVFRVSFVRDDFLELGKVRDSKFISYPPLDIVKKIGKYGRANSPNSTCLYCAFNPIIALLETKPKIGDRILFPNGTKMTTFPLFHIQLSTTILLKTKVLIRQQKHSMKECNLITLFLLEH